MVKIIKIDDNSYIKEYEYGSKLWYQNDKYHRLNGPAIEYCDGSKCWYQNDRLHRLHRLDGPAIENVDGDNYWFYEDQKIEGYFISYGELKRGKKLVITTR